MLASLRKGVFFMKDLKNVNAETGEVMEVVENKPIVNLRVQKFYLLSANFLEWEDKKTKEQRQAISLNLIDSVGFKEFSGQPIIENRNSIINGFVENPDPELLKLTTEPVFKEVVFKISGNESYIRLHGLLSDKQAKIYLSLLEN